VEVYIGIFRLWTYLFVLLVLHVSANILKIFVVNLCFIV